jgi:hypothetical protein
MFQFPSNWAASAGGAEQMIAKAVHKANARIRLPIMKDLMRVVLLVGSVVKKRHLVCNCPS